MNKDVAVRIDVVRVRGDDYFDPWPNMSKGWTERITVEIEDKGGDNANT